MDEKADKLLIGMLTPVTQSLRVKTSTYFFSTPDSRLCGCVELQGSRSFISMRCMTHNEDASRDSIMTLRHFYGQAVTPLTHSLINAEQ